MPEVTAEEFIDGAEVTEGFIIMANFNKPAFGVYLCRRGEWTGTGGPGLISSQSVRFSFMCLYGEDQNSDVELVDWCLYA